MRVTLPVEHEAHIARSWRLNAAAWTNAVRNGRIASRVRVTDRAMVDAILERSPSTLLDIGCGEGWLAREVGARGIDALGIDGSRELVAAATRAGGVFRTLSYDELVGGIDRMRDMAVCNFSLLGKESTERVFAAIPELVHPGGHFLVQTLHSIDEGGQVPARDGWRQGSWQGIEGAFSDPAPWYFRTIASWTGLFAAHALELLEIREPLDADSGRPASLLFMARVPGKPGDARTDRRGNEKPQGQPPRGPANTLAP